jgi:DNA primase
VRGERWHGRSQKWQTSSERDLLEESEAQLLRLYLHKPLHRSAIVEALEARDLEFSLSHHRFLWRQILALKEEGLDVEADPSLDLLTLLQDRCTDFPSDMSKIYALFQLDETGDINVLRSTLVIRAAVASMEKVMCEKRRRHFISLWEKTDCATAFELGQFYYKKIAAEEQRIQDLDRERQTTFEDLVQAPVIS